MNFEPREPRYQWGQRVRAACNLVNDGSYPERSTDELLVDAGAVGEIVRVGMHKESGTPIYLVEFSSGLVVGCLEEELALA
jgi:nitrogen fixation protein NifZ